MSARARILKRKYDKSPKNMRDHMYAWCAMIYKWDKEQVDRQEIKYLCTTMSINTDWLEEILDSFSGILK